jgi:outer membrane protein assembly factor BamB
MTLIKYLPLLILITCLSALSHAEKWKMLPPGTLQWQHITPIGDLLIGTSKGLHGVNEENGQLDWSINELAGISASDISPVSGSPFYSARKGLDMYMFDPNTGKLVFDSNTVGIREVKATFFIYDQDSVLVSGTSLFTNMSSIVLVDLATGNKKWIKEVDYDRILAVQSMDAEHILLISLFDMYKYHVETGELVWKRETTESMAGFENTGFGEFLKAAAEVIVADMEFKMDYKTSLDGKSFYVLSGDDDGSKASYFAFDRATGDRLWSKEYYNYNGKVVLLDKGMLTLSENSYGSTTNPWGYKINLLDYASGEGLYGKKGKGLKLKAGVSNYIQTDSGMLISVAKGDKAYLYLLDLDKGEFVHKKPTKMNGSLVALYEAPAGILCFTTEEINLLDLKSGKFLFKKPIKSLPQLTKKQGDNIYAYDTKAKLIKLIDINSGQITQLGKDKVKFEGKEKPEKLELREGGVLLSSSQNIMMIDFEGKKVFHEVYPAPAHNGWVRALYYMQGVHASVASAQSYYVSGAAAASTQTSEYKEAGKATQSLVQGIGQGYAEAGDQAQSVAIDSFKRANERFKASSQNDDVVIMLTKISKNTALVKLSKDTGEKIGQIDLGKEKEPNYTLDPVTGDVYLQEEANILSAHAL